MAQLIKTPHPVTLEGQEKIAVHLLPGESLFALLNRTLGAQLDNELWNVSVAGVEVPREKWHDCYPKDGQVIECVGDLGRSALMMVAIVALTIWTGGAFATIAASGGIAGMGAVASYAVVAGIQVAGSLLINKVLGPKALDAPDSSSGPASYSLNSTQNSPRQHGAVGLLFGRLRYAPDLLSQLYTYFDRDDMYMAMHLAWGIGVGRVEELRNGDTLLSDYDDTVQQWNTGFSALPDDAIPLFGNTDSQPGGALQDDDDKPLEVVRTTSVDTVRVMVNVSGTLHGVTRKGKLSYNQETFWLYWRRVGATAWQGQQSRYVTNNDRRTIRFTMIQDLPEGQYDIRVRRSGQQSTGDADVCEFSFDTLVSVQKDESTYRGLARTGFTLRANERLSSQPTAVNGLAIASAIPVWTGSQWVMEETSNPGAHMLKYLRGYYDREGNLIAGVGLDDQDIDIPAFQAFMVHCRTMGFTYNYWLNSERTHLEVLDALSAAGMGQFTDANGLYSVAWVAEDQPVDGTVNMARIKRGTFRVDYSLVGTADGVECRYWDSDKNKEALLRVPMPGVETMLNPAKLTFEGVTSEDHAVFLARYYLGQSLYQFKDVSFGTGLENLTYRRLSLLQISHDMTQWGYSGVVLSAQAVGNRIQFTLDEPVPAPPEGKTPFIGVRVPGQRACAVFRVQPFTGTSTVLTLDQAWPDDLPLPGNTTGNPAEDSIWIYDFKETPGLTVRVVNISRAADRSANVSVVVENQEFWNYVRTGEYVPADSGSLLQTRPVLSDLQVVDQQHVIGDVIQDQLVVSFQVSGPYEEAIVYTTESDGTLRERTRTRGRNAEFNIPGPGVYTVTVMPFNRQGLRGVGKSVTYATAGAGIPPVLVDYFDVEQSSAGVRFYTWGFYPDTIQSADYKGVEIRYNAGELPLPWEEMLPIGEDGYHTAPFEAIVPVAGTYTFACRSRNAAAILSTQSRILTKTLGSNLSEVLDGIKTETEESFEEMLQDIKQTQDALLEETRKREEDIREESDQRAQAVLGLEESIAENARSVLNEKLEREAAITSEAEARQSADDSLAYAISQVSAGTGQQFDSKVIWYFDTDAEGWPGSASGGFLDPGQVEALSPPISGLDGTQYRYIKMRVKRVGSPVWQGLLRWDNSAGPSSQLTMVQPTWDANGIGTVDAEDIPWTAGDVTRIGIALGAAVDADNYFLFDFIAVGRPTPGASVAMVQEESQARIRGDEAEAVNRQLLAVQVRGDYTGADAAQLQSGLLYSEGRLRITGDEALGTRIDSMQVSVNDVGARITEESRVRAAEDEALAQRVTVLSGTVDGKADGQVVQDLGIRVQQTEQGIQALGQDVTRIDVQLTGQWAGDSDWYAGDTNVYAGTINAYTAIASGDFAQAQALTVVRSEFGAFQSRVTQNLNTISTTQSSQGQAILAIQSNLGTKADAQAVQTLTTRVETVESRTTANAEAITQVNASLAGKAEAAVVQQMRVDVNNVTGQVSQVNARYFLGVQANGLVGGMYIGNNGQLVNVRFQADRFTIESPNGSGERFEYSNNSIKIYDVNGVLRVQMGVFA